MSDSPVRVGILTFHWATNYGAVLQAYALQLVLRRAGFEAEIIDFVPYRVYLAQAAGRLRARQYREFLKEYRIRRFLVKNAALSSHRYLTSRSLARLNSVYDAMIVGSDQIWNESMTLTGEKGPLLAYFLSSVRGRVKRIAYAASFGAESVSERYSEMVGPCVRGFDVVGVREESGKRIVEAFGVGCTVVVDPTLLLEREDYSRFRGHSSSLGKVVTFILHQQDDELLRSAEDAAASVYGSDIIRLGVASLAVEDWMSSLRSASFVVTNSYHAVIFCIQFNVPFIVVPASGGLSGMNDRMDTLLSTLGLAERILGTEDRVEIGDLVRAPIDWVSVGARLGVSRARSSEFLLSALGR